MNRTLTVFALASLILGSLAWGASVAQQSQRYGQCSTSADVRWHLDHSRNGVSLTCDASMINTVPLREGGQ